MCSTCSATKSTRFQFATNSPGETCDAPMCNEHAKQVGFICGKDPDSIDHCPYCRENARRTEDMVMFEDEATAARRRVHAEIRRSRMAKTTKEQA